MKGREELLTMSCYLHCFNKLHCFFVQTVSVIKSTALNYTARADVHVSNKLKAERFVISLSPLETVMPQGAQSINSNRE